MQNPYILFQYLKTVTSLNKCILCLYLLKQLLRQLCFMFTRLTFNISLFLSLHYLFYCLSFCLRALHELRTGSSYSHIPLLHPTKVCDRGVGAFHWPLFSPVCDAFQYVTLHVKFNYVDKVLVGIPHTTLPFCSNVHQEIMFHARCCRNMGILSTLV